MEGLRSEPSCLQIEARSIDRPLNLNFELNEKPGPDRKLRATLVVVPAGGRTLIAHLPPRARSMPRGFNGNSRRSVATSRLVALAT